MDAQIIARHRRRRGIRSVDVVGEVPDAVGGCHRSAGLKLSA